MQMQENGKDFLGQADFWAASGGLGRLGTAGKERTTGA